MLRNDIGYSYLAVVSSEKGIAENKQKVGKMSRKPLKISDK